MLWEPCCVLLSRPRFEAPLQTVVMGDEPHIFAAIRVTAGVEAVGLRHPVVCRAGCVERALLECRRSTEDDSAGRGSTCLV